MKNLLSLSENETQTMNERCIWKWRAEYRNHVPKLRHLIRISPIPSSPYDLYTFDQDEASSVSTYDSVTSAYERIFSRLSLPVRRVVGSPGKIGGRLSHEFQLPAAAGEDEIIFCQNCHDGINVELLQTEVERDAWRCHCHEPKVESRNKSG